MDRVKGPPAAQMAQQASFVSPNGPAPTGPGELYTVVSGDTLSKIAGRKLGDINLWTEIAECNPQIKDPDRIWPGDQIRLPVLEGRRALDEQQVARQTGQADTGQVVARYAQQHDATSQAAPKKDGLLNFMQQRKLGTEEVEREVRRLQAKAPQEKDLLNQDAFKRWLYDDSNLVQQRRSDDVSQTVRPPVEKRGPEEQRITEEKLRLKEKKGRIKRPPDERQPVDQPDTPRRPPHVGEPDTPRRPPHVGEPDTPRRPPHVGEPDTPRRPPHVGEPDTPRRPPHVGEPDTPRRPPHVGEPDTPRRPPHVGEPDTPRRPPHVGEPDTPRRPPHVGEPDTPRRPPHVGEPDNPRPPHVGEPETPSRPPRLYEPDSPRPPHVGEPRPPRISPPPGEDDATGELGPVTRSFSHALRRYGFDVSPPPSGAATTREYEEALYNYFVHAAENDPAGLDAVLRLLVPGADGGAYRVPPTSDDYGGASRITPGLDSYGGARRITPGLDSYGSSGRLSGSAGAERLSTPLYVPGRTGSIVPWTGSGGSGPLFVPGSSQPLGSPGRVGAVDRPARVPVGDNPFRITGGRLSAPSRQPVGSFSGAFRRLGGMDGASGRVGLPTGSVGRPSVSFGSSSGRVGLPTGSIGRSSVGRPSTSVGRVSSGGGRLTGLGRRGID